MADDVIVVENEYITIRYVPDKEFIHHTFHKPTQGAMLRESMLAGIEALEKYGACKWLSDDRKNGPLTPEDVEWGQNVWNPRAIEAGWKYWAIVVPTEVISAGSMVPTINALFQMGIRAMTFDNLSQAITWLDRDCQPE